MNRSTYFGRFSRSFTKLVPVLAFATLGLSLSQVAYALTCPLTCTGSYTGTSSTKSYPDADLVCRSVSPDSITIEVGGLPGSGTPTSFLFNSSPGGLLCKEVYNQNSSTPGVDATAEAPFTLTQVSLSPTNLLGSGLVLKQGTDGTNPTWTWIFMVDGTNATKEVARWKLTPDNRNPVFCGDVPASAECTSNQGTPDNPSATDFPNGVFNFTVVESNGQLIPKNFAFNPCHNGTFDGSLKGNGDLKYSIVCEGSGQTKGVKFRTDGTATIVIAMDVDIEPGQDPNLLNRNSTGYLTVAILSSANVNPATIDAANVTLDGVKATGPSDLNSDWNGDGVKDLTLRFSIPNDLLAANPAGSSLLKNSAPGVVSVPVRAPSSVGNTVYTGTGTITIVQPVRADYRPGCGNQLSIINPSGSDPVAILGGSSGAFDSVDVTKIMTQTTSPAGTVKLGGVVLTSPGIGDVSGSNCGTTTADGNPDGIPDLQFSVDVNALYLANQALFDAAADGDLVNLPVTGKLLNGAPVVGVATIKVQKK